MKIFGGLSGWPKKFEPLAVFGVLCSWSFMRSEVLDVVDLVLPGQRCGKF